MKTYRIITLATLAAAVSMTGCVTNKVPATPTQTTTSTTTSSEAVHAIPAGSESTTTVIQH